MTTHYHTTFYDGTEPADPRTRDLGNGKMVLNLPGCLDIQAPRDYLVRLLRAGLDALTDGTVAWGPDGAEVVPLRRPGKRRITIGVDDEQLEQLRNYPVDPLGPATPTARLVADILAAAAGPEAAGILPEHPSVTHALASSEFPVKALCGTDAMRAGRDVTCPECLALMDSVAPVAHDA